jgi:hypothetical protein
VLVGFSHAGLLEELFYGLPSLRVPHQSTRHASLSRLSNFLQRPFESAPGSFKEESCTIRSKAQFFGVCFGLEENEFWRHAYSKT